MRGRGGGFSIRAGNGSYKESHAKSYNSRNLGTKTASKATKTSIKTSKKIPVPCGSRYCRWMDCDKSHAKTCERHLWAKKKSEEEEYRQGGVGIATAKEAARASLIQIGKDDYREFISDLRKGYGTYHGLGDEAVNCGRWGLLRKCDRCGTKIVKRLVDGREWCPVCGKDGSEHHKRRVSRLIDRVYCMLDGAEAVGYFVFEYPLILREQSKDINELREAGNYVSRMLRREGFRRAVRRWHFYGEAKRIEGEDEDVILESIQLGKWHPHLNVLVESGKLTVGKIRRIRCLWTRWLERHYGVKLSGVAPVHYLYKKRPGQVWHLIKYITRPTFKKLTDENRRIASELFGFKNMSWFGKFSKEDKERGRKRFERWVSGQSTGKKEAEDAIDAGAVESCEAGICPRCGGNLEVIDVVRVDDFVIEEDYGAGYCAVRAPP